MKDTAESNCRMLLDVLMAHGLEDIVLSPGSRNTPLLIAASARETLHKQIINDERTAAFTALGIAIIKQKPVALVCTSGTALYNYAPAIAEAYYQNVPLIVISADRPRQWIDQDDSQTLRQYLALENIVKRSYDISSDAGSTFSCGNPEFESEREWDVNRIANEAVITAINGRRGPVHINIQLANPLNETTEYRERDVRKIELVENHAPLPPHISREFAENLLKKRVLIVAGFMPPNNDLNRAIKNIATLPNVAVMCETLSNLHLEEEAYMVDSVLSELTEEEKKELKPDIIISIGGALISRMLKEYLRGCEGAEHWTLSDTDIASDCMQRLIKHIEVEPAKFFKSVGGMMRHILKKKGEYADSHYRMQWHRAKQRAFLSKREYVENCGWSELKALDLLINQIPEQNNVFYSNGTCVRYSQILTSHLTHGCYGNRGVSGIDGTNATAYGMSQAYAGETLLVTGDMSFGYCPEILNMKGDRLRIVVINNKGGGIFRFIRTTRDLDIREEYFCANNSVPIKALTEAYGWNYYKAEDEGEMKSVLKPFFNTSRSLLEIKVDEEISSNILLKYFK